MDEREALLDELGEQLRLSLEELGKAMGEARELSRRLVGEHDVMVAQVKSSVVWSETRLQQSRDAIERSAARLERERLARERDLLADERARNLATDDEAT